MVLLTSSQVNVAISSGIIVLCTTALFLSGYVIQQRTLGHLRAAIRPDNTPQLFLPDRFRDDTTELADGTIVMLDEYNRPVRIKDGRLSVSKTTTAGEEGEAEGLVLEVKETLPEERLRGQEAEEGAREGQSGDEGEQQPPPPPTQDDQDPSIPSPDDAAQKPISRAERRRLIKEEIQRLAQGDQPVYYQRRLW